jgi:serine/threonine-protein kinase
LLAEHGATTPRRAVEIARKLASALGAAHDLGIVHRDVKPQNVLLDRDGEPFLADFGLATAAAAASSSRPGVFVGTPAYSSPEQARAESLDARADVYALGAVLHEMLTGRRAFPEAEPAKVLERQTSSPAPRPRDVDASVSSELDDIVAACLEPRRDARMPSARELEARLARHAKESA